MVKQLVILGDSFCHGIGTASVFKHADNVNYAFGKYIADCYNLKYVNLAEPGISILRTIELGYQYLAHNHHQVEQVIIGWTTPGRIGLYSKNSMLQILPSYICLGDSADDDVFVEHKNNVKFITNKQNKNNLKLLPDLHRLIIDNDFFNQQSLYCMCITLFKSWLKEQKISYVDFSVFGDRSDVELAISFNDVMITNRHPTKQEQEMFSLLMLKEMQ
jgi:hypothetical protein